MHTAVCVGPLSGGEERHRAIFEEGGERPVAATKRVSAAHDRGDGAARVLFRGEGSAPAGGLVEGCRGRGRVASRAGGEQAYPYEANISPLPFLRTLAARAERRHKDNSMSKRPREEASEESSDAAVAAPSVAPADTSADAAAIATGESHSSSQGSQGSRGISSRPPPTHAELQFATLWYYSDATQTMQGPFDYTSMRAWYDAGYMTATTLCSPSFYGEVPVDFWPIAELYSAGLEHAFVVADSVAAQAVEVAAALNRGPDYVPSDTFEGAKEGYIFKADIYGVGYYRDQPAEIRVTAETLEKEAAERRAKVRAFKSQAPVERFDGIGTG